MRLHLASMNYFDDLAMNVVRTSYSNRYEYIGTLVKALQYRADFIHTCSSGGSCPLKIARKELQNCHAFEEKDYQRTLSLVCIFCA